MSEAQTLELSIKLPDGVNASPELQDIATKAITNLVAQLEDVAELAEDLQSKGFDVSAQDLLSAKKGGSSFGARRRRRTLTVDERKEIIEKLKQGSTARACAEDYGVSTATVNNIKRDAGLTKASEAQKKAFARRAAQKN